MFSTSWDDTITAAQVLAKELGGCLGYVLVEVLKWITFKFSDPACTPSCQSALLDLTSTIFTRIKDGVRLPKITLCKFILELQGCLGIISSLDVLVESVQITICPQKDEPRAQSCF